MASSTDYILEFECSWFAILSRPSIKAMSPPVEVPQIKSKKSHGRGEMSGRPELFAAYSRAIWRMRSFRIYRLEIPRTPPPSRERIRRGFSVMTECVVYEV